ncbi:hypothetical protein GOODEAATRI_016365 [Goodea atripinnis]|uniref:BRICHOS domain-containing protein n=1 Tax=Goodea atripinnis TaxID=208336 RepID=A0ABV0NCF9_9TELE
MQKRSESPYRPMTEPFLTAPASFLCPLFICTKTSFQGGGFDSSSYLPKAFWIGLSAILLLVVVALGLAGHLVLAGSGSKGLICYKPVDQDSCFLQTMVRSDYEHVGSLVNASGHKDLFTGGYSSKPEALTGAQWSLCVRALWLLRCLFLDSKGPSRNIQLSGNKTQRRTEFLGVLAASQVNVSSLEEPLQTLCQDRSVHWTRRTDGESS